MMKAGDGCVYMMGVWMVTMVSGRGRVGVYRPAHRLLSLRFQLNSRCQGVSIGCKFTHMLWGPTTMSTCVCVCLRVFAIVCKMRYACALACVFVEGVVRMHDRRGVHVCVCTTWVCGKGGGGRGVGDGDRHA